MEDKKEFEEPSIEIVLFNDEDIITTSNPQSTDVDNDGKNWGNINFFD